MMAHCRTAMTYQDTLQNYTLVVRNICVFPTMTNQNVGPLATSWNLLIKLQDFFYTLICTYL